LFGYLIIGSFAHFVFSLESFWQDFLFGKSGKEHDGKNQSTKA
jgi:hypothetical protein